MGTHISKGYRMKLITKSIVLAAVSGIATGALGGTPGLQITFDEFDASNSNSAVLSNEYAGIGVTFVNTDDGAVWDGLTGGDLGNWGIEGTNGTQFMGFNGDSYGSTMLFDTTVRAFQLDASRSNGSSSGDTFTLEGYRDSTLVESITITFGDLNDWSTLFLNENVDEVQWYGTGVDFHPFGIDNIAWREVPAPSAFAMMGLTGLIAGKRRR